MQKNRKNLNKQTQEKEPVENPEQEQAKQIIEIMKKILSVLLFITTFNVANAQTAQETVDWLAGRHTALKFSARSNIIVYPGTEEIEFNVSYIKITKDGASTKLPWSSIKMITGYYLINIITYEKYDNTTNYFIQLFVELDYEKIKKALVHLATLNNAKLIKEDLFED